jgi:hypothetical protein
MRCGRVLRPNRGGFQVPYIIRPKLLPRSAVLAGVALLASAAPALANGVKCPQPKLTQPFLPDGDTHYYVLPPGEAPNSFIGKGWTLTGGAEVTKAKIAHGKTGTVLYLRGGSSAVSPTFCVTTDYPTARAVVNNINGSGSVSFGVSYLGTPSWEAPKDGGHLLAPGTEWMLAEPVLMEPEEVDGWQYARLTLTGLGSEQSGLAIYNLYVDPYRR